MIQDFLEKVYIHDIKVSLLLDLFILSFLRIFGFLVFSPILVKPAFSGVIRTGFAISLGFIVAPYIYGELEGERMNGIVLFTTAFKELILGMIMGFTTWLVVHAIQFAGVIIDTQRGATTSQDFNPLLATTSTGLSNLLVHAFTAYFFAIGGFIFVLKLVLTSYLIWPILSPLPVLNGDLMGLLFIEVSSILKYGLMLASPILIATLIVDLHIAYLSKKAQQLQPLTFSGPIKTVVAIFLLLFSLESILPKAIERMINSLEMTMQIMQSSKPSVR